MQKSITAFWRRWNDFRTAAIAACVLVAIACPRHAAAAQASCESLSTLRLDHTEITLAQPVPEGPFTVQGFA